MNGRRPLVGWYVHHHGAGHRTRFEAVRARLDADVIVFSTLLPPLVLPDHTNWVMLDRDDQVERTESGARRDPAVSAPTAGGALHWAPLNHSGHASRLGMIAASLTSERFDCFVVDVSVEVTLLARLFGVPTVIMTQPGERADPPHQLAFTAASRIVAPWPGGVAVPRALEPFRAKVCFVGGISRFAGRRAPGAAVVPPAATVLVLAGGGSAAGAEGAAISAQVEAAAEATTGAAPGTTWHALGLPASANVTSSGWNDDPFELLSRAGVVVSFAGQNAVADLAAIGARAIVIAQPRPFGEQLATVAALDAAGLAVTARSWPAPADWPDLLARAAASTPDWSAWQTDGAAERAAAVIAEVAGSSG